VVVVLEELVRLVKNVGAEKSGDAVGPDERWIFERAAGAHLLEHPLAFFSRRFVRAVAREDIEICVLLDTAMAEIERPVHTHPQCPDRRIQIFRLCERLHDALAIFRPVAELACFDEGGNEREVFGFALGGKITADHQDLFRMQGRELGTSCDTPTGPAHDRQRVPRFADAISIKVSVPQIRKHLRWRHGHDLDIDLWFNTGRAQPFAENEIVGGKGKGNAKK
jgi:hypothetical protein